MAPTMRAKRHDVQMTAPQAANLGRRVPGNAVMSCDPANMVPRRRGDQCHGTDNRKYTTKARLSVPQLGCARAASEGPDGRRPLTVGGG
jgi:hypothetical protein